MSIKGKDFLGFKIIESDVIPEGTIIVHPNDKLLFTDPKQWYAIKAKQQAELKKAVDTLSNSGKKHEDN